MSYEKPQLNKDEDVKPEVGEELRSLNAQVGQDLREDESLMEELHKLNQEVSKNLDPEKQKAKTELLKLRTLELRIDVILTSLNNLIDLEDTNGEMMADGSMDIESIVSKLSVRKEEIKTEMEEKEGKVKAMNL
ncbi:MAG: hypothetical protein WED06_02555 [Candidatus Paceibacterota bacterium]